MINICKFLILIIINSNINHNYYCDASFINISSGGGIIPTTLKIIRYPIDELIKLTEPSNKNMPTVDSRINNNGNNNNGEIPNGFLWPQQFLQNPLQFIPGRLSNGMQQSTKQILNGLSSKVNNYSPTDAVMNGISNLKENIPLGNNLPAIEQFTNGLNPADAQNFLNGLSSKVNNYIPTDAVMNDISNLKENIPLANNLPAIADQLTNGFNPADAQNFLNGLSSKVNNYIPKDAVMNGISNLNQNVPLANNLPAIADQLTNGFNPADAQNFLNGLSSKVDNYIPTEAVMNGISNLKENIPLANNLPAIEQFTNGFNPTDAQNFLNGLSSKVNNYIPMEAVMNGISNLKENIPLANNLPAIDQFTNGFNPADGQKFINEISSTANQYIPK